MLVVIFIFPLASSDLPELGQKAPDFELRNLKTKQPHRLSQYVGKIIVLDFWATWCPPCKKSLPKLALIAKTYSEDVQILAISIDDSEDNAYRFIVDNKIDMLTLYDDEKEVVGSYDIPAMPTLFIIDRDGVIRSLFEGYTEDSLEEIEEKIKELR
jgi:peroxiredoxin